MKERETASRTRASVALSALALLAPSSWLAGCGDLSADDGAAGGGAHTASAATSFDGIATPAITSRGNGTLEVFAIKDGYIQERSFTNSAGWTWGFAPVPPPPPGRKFQFKPAATSWSSTRMDLFACDDQKTLQHLRTNNGVWRQIWESRGTFDWCLGAGASSSGPDSIDVFVKTNSTFSPSTSQVMQLRYRNGWQAAQATLGPSIPGDVASLSPVSWGTGRIDLIVGYFDRGPAQYFTNDGGATWSGPWTFAPPDSSFTTAYGYLPIATATTWGVNVLDIISVKDNRVAHRKFRPTTGWSDWAVSTLQNPPPVVPSTGLPASVVFPAAVSSGTGRIDVVSTLGFTGEFRSEVWHSWFNESAPAGWWGGEEL